MKDLPDEYQCMICAKLLNEPHLTDCCGQHFCQACLQQWFKKQAKKICPHCRSETFTHMRSLPLKRKIDVLEVYYPNQKEGCKEILKLGALDVHKHVCDFAKVYCTQGCGKLILCKDLAQHCNNECSERKIKCKYCEELDHHEVINGRHTIVCEEYPVKCPRGCTQSVGDIKRKYLKKHAEVCPLEEVQCPFSEVGCDASILRKDVNAHIEANGQEHLMKMMTAYNKLKEDFKQMSSCVANLLKMKGAYNKLKKDFKQMSSCVTSVTPIEPVRLTRVNDNFSFIITSSKGWRSPPFCVPGGYIFCIKHKEGNMASLILFKEKHSAISRDARYAYKLEISYSEVVSATIPSTEPQITDAILFDFELKHLSVVDCDKEVASITMPKGDLLSINNIIIITVTLECAWTKPIATVVKVGTGRVRTTTQPGPGPGPGPGTKQYHTSN